MSSLRRILLIAAVAVSVSNISYGKVIFKADFDESYDAAVSGGSAEAKVRGSGLVRTEAGSGCPANVSGSALDQQNVATRTQRGATVSYPWLGNIKADSGSVSLWVKRNGGGTYNTFFCVGNALWDRTFNFNIFYDTTSKKLYFRYRRGDGESIDAVITGGMQEGKWYHVAASWSYDHGNGIMKLDGHLARAGGAVVSDSVSAEWKGKVDWSKYFGVKSRMWVSTSSNGLTPANSYIDELIIWDSPLDFEQIRDQSERVSGVQSEKTAGKAAGNSDSRKGDKGNDSVIYKSYTLDEVDSRGGCYKQIVPIPELNSLPVIDGKIDLSVSENAFSVDSMFALDSLEPAKNKTKTFVGRYDGCLYVGTICSYKKGKSLVANAVNRDDPSWSDDCVELLINSLSRNQNYHWVVNSKGVLYDEMGRDSSWNGKDRVAASVGEDQWQAEFLINLSALGIDSVEGAAFIVGRNDRTLLPSQISALNPVKGNSLHNDKYYSAAVPVDGGASFSTHYDFIAGGPGIHGFNAMVGVGSMADGAKVIANVYDNNENKRLDRQIGGEGQETPAFDHFLSVTDPVVHQFLVEIDGRVYANIVQPVVIIEEIEVDKKVEITKEKFPWLGNDLGIDESVPSPWTAVEFAGGKLRAVGREYSLGDEAVFDQVSAAGRSLFDSGAKLVAVSNGKKYYAEFSSVGVKEKQDNRIVVSRDVKWGGIAEGDIEVVFEYDGLSWMNLEVSTESAIDGLYFEVGLDSDYFKYLTVSAPVNVSRNEQVKLLEEDASYEFRFIPSMWLGDEKSGLLICADSDQGWSIGDLRKVYQIECGKDATRARLNFVSRANTELENASFEWGIQATPAKPKKRSLEDMAWVNVHYSHTFKRELKDYPGQSSNFIQWLDDCGVKVVVLFNHWTIYQGGELANEPETVKWIVEECHKRGMKVLLYRSCEMANCDPKWDAFAETTLAQPTSYGYHRNYPVKQTAYIYCSKSVMKDYFIGSCDWLMREYGVDGFYLDGVVSCGGCYSSEHGCGYVDENGQRHVTYGNLAVRDMLQRLYKVVKSYKPDGLIDAHAGHYILPMGFATSYYNGEQYYKLRHYDKEPSKVLPQYVFRSVLLPDAKGMSSNLLIYDGCPFTADEANAISFINGVSPRPHALEHVFGRDNLIQTSPIWRAFGEYDIDEAKWVPYWSQDYGIRVSYDQKWIAKQEKAFVSYYEREDDYLYLLSNFAIFTIQASIENDELAGGEYEAVDMLTGDQVNIDGGKVWTFVEPYKIKLVRVRKR